MTNSKLILHDGKVVKTEDDKIKVKIVSFSACASCHARGSCTAADMSEKYIDALPGENFREGDDVTVIIEEKFGWVALLYGILLPFLIVVSTLFILIGSGGSEPFSAVISLLTLVPYYFILHLFRGKMEKKFTFKAERRTQT